MKIIVDADAQPAKDRIEAVAREFGVELVFVLSVAHYSERNEKNYGSVMLVDNRKQEADIAIMNAAQPGDIAVTNDTGLASVLIGKKVFTVTPRGKMLDASNIDKRLAETHEIKKAARSKAKGRRQRVKGPVKYTGEDADRLAETLKELIERNS